MAVKLKLYVELHVRTDDQVARESANRLPELLMALLADGRLGAFTGEEYRVCEAVLFFESTNLTSALPKVRELVDGLDLLRQSSVVVRKEALPSESDLSLPLCDLELWWDRLDEFVKRRVRTRGRRPKVHDYYAVPLPDGRFGHLQYLHHDPTRGDLVQVLAVITADGACRLEELIDAKPLFPPVQTPVTVGIRIGGWIFIGNRQRRDEFRFPTFRGTNSLLLRQHEPGIYQDWWLWSGGESWQPVGMLTDEQRELEYNVTWPPQDLARRIVSGENEYDQFR